MATPREQQGNAYGPALQLGINSHMTFVMPFRVPVASLLCDTECVCVTHGSGGGRPTCLGRCDGAVRAKYVVLLCT